MPSTFDQGDLVRVTNTFTDTGGTPADPTTVYFHYENPSLVTSTFTRTSTALGVVGGIRKMSVGVYVYDIPATGRGLYETRFFSTGAITAASESWFSVRPLRVST